MSRRREEQRDKKRELARQLGVAGREVDAQLLDNERVTTPRLAPSLVVQHVRRGLFARPAPASLHIALYVVDPAGARLCLSSSHDVVVGSGDVALPTQTNEDSVVRYRRPGHFVLVACLVEGGTARARAARGTRLCDASTLAFVVDGALRPLRAVELARITSARSVALSPPCNDDAFVFDACSLVSVPAADRVRVRIDVPLSTADGRFQAALVVDARL